MRTSCLTVRRVRLQFAAQQRDPSIKFLRLGDALEFGADGGAPVRLDHGGQAHRLAVHVDRAVVVAGRGAGVRHVDHGLQQRLTQGGALVAAGAEVLTLLHGDELFLALGPLCRVDFDEHLGGRRRGVHSVGVHVTERVSIFAEDDLQPGRLRRGLGGLDEFAGQHRVVRRRRRRLHPSQFRPVEGVERLLRLVAQGEGGGGEQGEGDQGRTRDSSHERLRLQPVEGVRGEPASPLNFEPDATLDLSTIKPPTAVLWRSHARLYRPGRPADAADRLSAAPA